MAACPGIRAHVGSYGEHETVVRAARRILRAYIDWGVLHETEGKGLYRGTAKRAIDTRHSPSGPSEPSSSPQAIRPARHPPCSAPRTFSRRQERKAA